MNVSRRMKHLQQAERYAYDIGPVAVMVIVWGAVIAAWGETAHLFNVRSIRKSMLSALYGIWRVRQITLQRWVAESTRAQARTPDGTGYGYMWWVAVAGNSPLPPQVVLPDGAFAALGVGGQLLLIIPSRDLVLVHLTNPDEPGYRPVRQWDQFPRCAGGGPRVRGAGLPRWGYEGRPYFTVTTR